MESILILYSKVRLNQSVLIIFIANTFKTNPRSIRADSFYIAHCFDAFCYYHAIFNYSLIFVNNGASLHFLNAFRETQLSIFHLYCSCGLERSSLHSSRTSFHKSRLWCRSQRIRPIIFIICFQGVVLGRMSSRWIRWYGCAVGTAINACANNRYLMYCFLTIVLLDY